MSFQWEDIIRQWPECKSLSYDPREIVEAFNIVERIIGLPPPLSPHAQPSSVKIRGMGAAIRIIDLGLALKEIEGTVDGQKLIEKIKRNFKCFWKASFKTEEEAALFRDQTCRQFRHDMRLAQLAAHYRRCNLEVELEPEISGHPDMKVKFNDQWILVEVTRLVSPRSSTLLKLFQGQKKVPEKIELPAILRREIKHFLSENPGMIVIETYRPYYHWPELTKRLLRLEMYRRVSGVLFVVYSSAHTLEHGRMKSMKTFIENPNPFHPLPKGFIEITFGMS